MRRPPGLREPAAMDAALAAVAAMHGGVFTRQQALTCGVSDMALLGLTRGKEVITLGRSAYAVASAVPDRAQPGYDVAFHALRARAALLVYPDAHLCGVSLLAVAGVDIYGADLRRVELVRDVRQEVLTQLCRIRPRHAVIRPGLPKDPSPRAEGVAEAIAGAVVQLAMDHGFLAGVCSADDAMHDGWTTREDLARAVGVLAHWSRGSRAQTMLAFADGRSESVGESRLRVILVLGGIPVEPQYIIKAGGTVIACCDLKVKGVRLVLEFDGKVKYAGAGGEVLWKEKKREDGIRRTNHGAERVIWVELDREAVLLARVRAAIAAADLDTDGVEADGTLTGGGDCSAPDKSREDPTTKLG